MTKNTFETERNLCIISSSWKIEKMRFFFMNVKLTNKQLSIVGFMLFGIFFGAGNFIFPPLLGYQAGINVVPALIGFLLGAVGLPLLGVIASTLFGGEALKLMDRVHPIFGVIFTSVLYLAIGPLFAVPRTATVAFSMAAEPFLGNNWYILAIFTLIYFGITFYLCLTPTRLVSAIGKFMTPALMIIVAAIVVKAMLTPVGTATDPTAGFYYNAIFEGLINGFQTMDAIGGLITAGIVISAVKQFGATDKKDVAVYTIKAGLIAAVGLSIIYGGLALVGSTSGTFMEATDGAVILTTVVQELFGPVGLVLLGIATIMACLSTAIALAGASASYFHQLMPSLSYQKWLLIFCLFGFGISNLGLATLLAVTAPVLQILYPLVIVLIVYIFIDRLICHKRMVYILGMTVTLIISTSAELNASGFIGASLSFVESLPMYDVGFPWVAPWLIATLVAYFIPTKSIDSVEKGNVA